MFMMTLVAAALPILIAMRSGVENVKAFIKLGVDVNCLSEGGDWSGLAICAKNNYLQLLDILLSCPDIDVNNMNADECLGLGWGGNIVTALEACHSNNHEIVRRLHQVPGIDFNHKIGYLMSQVDCNGLCC